MLKPHRALLIVLFVLLIGTLAVFVKKESAPQTAPMPPKTEATGHMKLEALKGEDVQTGKSRVTILLSADSAGQEITGFDAVVRFPTETLTFVEDKSAHDAFDIVTTRNGEGEIIITGIKKLNYNTPLILASSPLAYVTFDVIGSTGVASVELVYSQGSQTDSNLITVQSKDILSGVTNSSIVLGQEISIQKGEEFVFEDLRLTLTETEKMLEGCSDCVESAHIIARVNGQDASLTFAQGGIDGRVEMTKEVEGYVIEVTRIKDDGVMARVGKK